MKRGITVTVCRACGRSVFPRRALCSGCGGTAWRPELVEDGVVEEVTTVHHVAGAEGEAPIGLASIRLDVGPVVVARLDGEAAFGERVELLAVDGAPIARRCEVGTPPSSAPRAS